MPIPAAPAGHPPAYTPFQYPQIDKSSLNHNAFPGGAGFNIPPKHDLPNMQMPPLLPNLPSDKELNVDYTVRAT